MAWSHHAATKVGEDERTRSRRWRDEVQRAFFSKAELTAEDMPDLDALFKEIEADEHMTRDALASSSLHKVLRAVGFLPEDRVPLDNVYRFRERADKIVSKWNEISHGSTSAPPDTSSPVQALQAPVMPAQSNPEMMMVRRWRHNAQKAFLSNKTIKEEDIPGADMLFRTIESYDKMSEEQLQHSKIGKVMRHIATLPDDKIPLNQQYKFRERAIALIEKWMRLLVKDVPPESVQSAGEIPMPAVAAHAGGKEEELNISVEAALAATEEDWVPVGYDSDDWVVVDVDTIAD